MNDRRRLLRTGAALALSAPLPGARGALVDTVRSNRDPEQSAAHALNRLGFGPRPGDLSAVGRDVAGWIERQLQPQTMPLPASLLDRLDEDRFTRMDPIAVLREYVALVQRNALTANVAQTMSPLDQAPARQPTELGLFVRGFQIPAAQSRLFRALESPRQLEEVMVDFWFNHFNVFQGKNFMRVLVGHYEQYAIRPFAMGRFRDLLGATAHHPAMLYYLDNWQSVGGRADGRRGLNENYARELMELHTLGVDAGYSQADVTELARMFTGWTLVPLRAPGQIASGATVTVVAPGRATEIPGYWFNGQLHDAGEKIWMGRHIPAQGKAEGDLALDVLAGHPATARHICAKLVQYFVSDLPDPTLVGQMANAFIASDGQIVPVLRALFHSEAFWSPATIGTKFKTPYHYALSMLRAGGYGLGAVNGVADALAAQGMPLFGCPTPDGYKNTEAAWLNPDGMSKRINFATRIASGNLAGERLTGERDADALMAQLGPLVTPATRRLVDQSRHDPVLALALVLAGPAMMRR